MPDGIWALSMNKVYNSFWSWIRITEPIKIWFSPALHLQFTVELVDSIWMEWEIGDESWIRTWILMSSVILIQLQKLFYKRLAHNI